ncbi:MAG: hypothetical protein FJ390_07865 [Verrucomicrobia bacterium]|nr:hypothetical protein [Verrucomicrobiota bacterium]
MKIKNISFLVFSLLLSLSALHAVPTDPALPTNPPLPTPPTPPPSESGDTLVLGLSDSGSTHTISASGFFEIQLPANAVMSWCYVESVALDNGLFVFSYNPITYTYNEDPNDDSKVKIIATSDWIFAPLSNAAGTSVTLSFYARDYDGRLFPAPYNQVYTFTINIGPATTSN